MTALAALTACLAVWCAIRPPTDRRVGAVFGVRANKERSTPKGLAAISAAILGLGVALLVGGVAGAVTGVFVAALLPRVLSRLETGPARHRRNRLVKQAPDIADLLAATLASGAPLHDAIRAVAEAVGSPSADLLRPVVAGLDLGADPGRAWGDLVDDPALGPIALAFVRSSTSGAPVAGVLAGTADDLRRKHRLAVEVAARSAGVRAVAPLAACFLPAFLLLGVVPVVASMATSLLNG